MDDTMTRLRYLFQTTNEFSITLPGTGMGPRCSARASPDSASWTRCAS